jgi:mannose-6-phosphate isomerase-like protein (cupin superfamily)
VVLSGSARVKLGTDVVEVQAWDALRVPAETMRDLEAGPEGVEMLAFGAPYTGPPGALTSNDAEMTPNWWTD